MMYFFIINKFDIIRLYIYLFIFYVTGLKYEIMNQQIFVILVSGLSVQLKQL